MTWRLALLGLVAGCGRYAFDGVARDDSGTSGPDAYDPGLFVPVGLPSGGVAEGIAIGATAGEVITWMDGRGLYRTTDSGLNWTECGQLRARRAAVTSDGTIYTRGDDDVYASTDGCQHWQRTGLPLDTEVLAANGTTVYAGTEAGLRAYDGQTWSVVSSPFEGSEIEAIGLRDQLMLIGSSAGVARSVDGGATWTVQNQGLVNLQVEALAVAGSDALRAYAMEVSGGGTTGGLFRSDDGGLTWTQVYGNGGFGIAIDPQDPNNVLYANYNTLLGATDGSNFVDVRSTAMESSNPRGVAFDKIGGSYAATTRGVFYRQGAASFAPRHSGIDAWSLDHGTTSPTRDSVYWSTPAGLLSSTDGGSSYNLVSNIGIAAAVENVFVLPQAPANVFAGDRYVGHSDDRGVTFSTVIDVGAINGWKVWSYGALSTQRVIATTRTQVLYSDPPWTTWNATTVGLTMDDEYENAVLPTDEIVVIGDEGLFHSTDLGISFQAMTTTMNINHIFAGPQGQLLGAFNGLFERVGGAWQAHGLEGLEIHSLLFAGSTWVAATSTGVYVAHDDGVTWDHLAGLGGRGPRSLARDAAGNLLVGTEGYGLYRSPFP